MHIYNETKGTIKTTSEAKAKPKHNVGAMLLLSRGLSGGTPRANARIKPTITPWLMSAMYQERRFVFVLRTIKLLKGVI